MKRCAFEHTFVCVVLRTRKVCCSNTPNLRVYTDHLVKVYCTWMMMMMFETSMRNNRQFYTSVLSYQAMFLYFLICK